MALLSISTIGIVVFGIEKEDWYSERSGLPFVLYDEVIFGIVIKLI